MLRRLGLSILSRRRFMGAAGLVAGATAAAGLSTRVLAADQVIKIGFLAPLTGPVAAWGKPVRCRLYERWRAERPAVFDDTRKLLAAALLVGAPFNEIAPARHPPDSGADKSGTA